MKQFLKEYKKELTGAIITIAVAFMGGLIKYGFDNIGKNRVVTPTISSSETQSIGSIGTINGDVLFSTTAIDTNTNKRESRKKQIIRPKETSLDQPEQNNDTIVKPSIVAPNGIVTSNQSGGTNVVNNTYAVPPSQFNFISWSVTNQKVDKLRDPDKRVGKNENGKYLIPKDAGVDSVYRNTIGYQYLPKVSKPMLLICLTRQDIVHVDIRHGGRIQYGYEKRKDGYIFRFELPESGYYTFEVFTKTPIISTEKFLLFKDDY